MSALEFCHVFMFVEPGAPEASSLDDLGLRESYRRAHPGQGTANVCYCFDNAFLELLWVTDWAAITSPAVARTGLAKRADWQQNGANPFGIALRSAGVAPFPTWDYKPPYLPAGKSIPIALSSKDPTQPLLFISPGNARPDQWQDGRAGNRQCAAGLSEVKKLELSFADGVQPSDDLQALLDAEPLALGVGHAGPGPKLTLTLTRSDGGPDQHLELPAMTWIDA